MESRTGSVETLPQDATKLFSLTGKKILATGGSGFLGKNWIKAIRKAGGTPCNLDIVPDKSSFTIRADILDTENILRRLAGMDFDGLVNGIFYNPSPNVPATEEDWDRQSALLKATEQLIRYVAIRMNPGGSIVNVGSDLSLIAPDPRLYEGRTMKGSHYTIFKHAIIGLTRHYAPILAKKNIRINTLCPGSVYNGDDEFKERLEKLIPMGRVAQPDEYDGAIIFLLSDASRYMTGSTLVMDGGRTCW